MIYKLLAGTTLQWSINLPETRFLLPLRRIHCSVSVLIRKRTGEEIHIIIDSLSHLVDLLVRSFDKEGFNLLGVPALSLKRAIRSIAVYFGLDDEKDFLSDLEYEYFKFLTETGFPSPFGFLTPRKLKEMHEQSMQLKSKLQGFNTSEREILQEAIDILDRELENLET
jgi:hypothetical protein